MNELDIDNVYNPVIYILNKKKFAIFLINKELGFCEAAKKIGISYPTLMRLLNSGSNYSRPQYSTLKKILNFLGPEEFQKLFEKKELCHEHNQ